MVLVKPTPVTSALSAWKEVQRSRFCALQKRTIGASFFFKNFIKNKR